MSLLNERLATHLTGMRSLIGVDLDVLEQNGIRCEGLGTMNAMILARVLSQLSGMNRSHVMIGLGLLHKPFSAKVARMRPISRVGQSVLAQFGFVAADPITDVTLVPLIV